jgi:transglutaminase-like putative cysteine protease
MSRGHSAPAGVLAAAAACACWLVLSSWTRLLQEPDGLMSKLLVAIALVSVTGVALRRLGLEWPFAWCGQLLVAALVLQAQLGTRLAPSPTSLRSAVRAVLHAADSAAVHPAPVASDVASIVPLLLVAGVALHLVVDLVAVSLRRPLPASLPLLAAWVLPVGVLGTTSGSVRFVAAAAAWLAMLAADQRAERRRWGRALAASWTEAVRPGRTAFVIGAVAILTAVVLPPVLPHRAPLALSGSGPGTSTTVRLTDPVADLRRNLVRGEDIDLLHITVPDGSPAPAYVRLSVLDQFDGATWRVGSRSWPAGNGTRSGVFPWVPALDLPGRRVAWRVAVSHGFASDWLPTPRWTVSLLAGPDWRYDSETLDVHRAGSPGTAADTRYAAMEYVPSITAEALAASTTHDRKVESFTALPRERPAWVHDLAVEVTRGATTDYARAVALQQFFQRNFTYSTATAPGSGFAALEEFLEHSRSGYCEQFAASMALLARELGMPARVSVGFLRPERRGKGSYEFSAHDLHAWPELWFRGVGWVGFEPTPTSHTGSVPSWSQPPRETSPSTSASPTVAPSTAPKPQQHRPDGSSDASSGGRLDWRAPAGLAALALLALAACLPRLLRRAQRARRLGSDDVEEWWTELHASVVDLGLRWPAGASPRAIAHALRPHLDEPVVAGAALDRLVGSVELARYAPDGHGTATPGDVSVCAAALRAGVAPRDVRRERWWPRSVVGQGRLRSAESA